MKKAFKIITPILLFGAIWTILFFGGRYMLYLQEQLQLFQNDWNYFIDNCQYNAGFAQMVSEFIIQFCHKPWLGTMIIALLLTITIYAFKSILQKCGCTKGVTPLAIVPIIPLIYSLIIGEFAFPITQFIIATIGSWAVVNIPTRYRYIGTMLISPLLFWLCGAPAILLPIFTIIIAVNEKCSAKNIVLNTTPLLVYLLFGVIGVRIGFIGSMDHFINHTMIKLPLKTLRDAQPLIVVGWYSSIIVALYGLITKNREFITENRWLNISLQTLLVVIMGAVVWFKPDIQYTQNVTFKEYNLWAKLHYLYTQSKHQELLDLYNNADSQSIIESNYINLSLYREGRLVKDFFKYSPNGHTSLLTNWADAPFPIAFLWGEVSSEMGFIAKSGQTAYEGNVLSGPRGSSMFMKLLVESEIIMGNYKTAKKYIEALENTIYYKEWATQQRQFLSDKAVAQSKYYNAKRKCIIKGNAVMALTNELILLKEIIKINPLHKSTFDFASLMTLSAGAIPAFREIITEGVQSRNFMPPFDGAIQEGLIIAYNQYPVFWNFYKVSTDLQNAYQNFAQAIKERNSNPMGAKAVFSQNEGRYWHYIETMTQRAKAQQNQPKIEQTTTTEIPNN